MRHVGSAIVTLMILGLAACVDSSEERRTVLISMSRAEIIGEYESHITGHYCRSTVENCTIESAAIIALYFEEDKAAYFVLFARGGQASRVFVDRVPFFKR